MLTTKNIVETTRISKTLNPGKHLVKLNSITLKKGYEANSYNVILNVEGPDQGPEFEGFLVNIDDKTGPRYTGQIGRVMLSQYAYKDGVTKTGVKVSRDQSILRALKVISKALGKEDQLDLIQADTIEEFVEQASAVLAGDDFMNMIIGGKTWEKDGYTQYNLYLPVAKDGKYVVESANVKEGVSKLVEFNPEIHITHKAAATPVESFEPQQNTDTSFAL